MADGFHRILNRLPFAVREIHSDNGGEFLSDHMLRFWPAIDTDIQLTRGRPHHKNDNRFVEQKNATLVPASLGYRQLDSVAQANALNQLFDKMWLYFNFFQPVMHLTEKTIISRDGQLPLFKRRYDLATTPFDRLCAKEILEPTQIALLKQLRSQTNPRRLRQEVYNMIHYIFSLPGLSSGESEDVRLTLRPPAQQASKRDNLAIEIYRTENGFLTNTINLKDFLKKGEEKDRPLVTLSFE